MVAMIKFLMIITTTFCFASTACAIRCKVCHSLTTSDCDDPFPAGERYDSECKDSANIYDVFSSFVPNVRLDHSSATGCLKMKYTTEGKVHVNRLCYYGQIAHVAKFCIENYAGSMRSSPAKELSCDLCDGDLCNSSTTTGILAATLLLLVVLVRLMA